MSLACATVFVVVRGADADERAHEGHHGVDGGGDLLRVGPAPHARQRAVEHGERGQGDEAQPLQNVVDLVVELQFHFNRPFL